MNILDKKTGTQILATTIISHLARAISLFEGIVFGNMGPEKPPIFIFGLPRGGTTLVYQAFCHAFDLAFTPMITNKLPFAPALSSRAYHRQRGGYRSDFQSSYGESSDMGAPGESTVWNIYFEKDRWYQTVSELPAWKARDLIKFIGRIERIGGAPFANKNLRHPQRLGVLSELFPSAIFITILRHPRDVSLSLLRGRIEKMGDADAWFSIKPREIDLTAARTPEEEVVNQVAGIINNMDTDIRRLGNDRFAVMSYEGFCKAPVETCDRLASFALDRGLELKKRYDLPSSFKITKGRTDKLSSETINRLDELLTTSFSNEPYKEFPGYWLTGHRT